MILKTGLVAALSILDAFSFYNYLNLGYISSPVVKMTTHTNSGGRFWKAAAKSA
jgi:hypothetical protein